MAVPVGLVTYMNSTPIRSGIVTLAAARHMNRPVRLGRHHILPKRRGPQHLYRTYIRVLPPIPSFGSWPQQPLTYKLERGN